MATLTNKRPRSDSDGDEIDTSTIFRSQEKFAKFLIIESTNKDKPITSLSPFVIEKQIEALIGTVKSAKKLRNQTLLVETTRKSQTENLLTTKTFFNLPVQVSEHKTLNSSKGIIRDRALKGESDDNIRENLKEQGVIAAKRFKVKKGHDFVNTNTILLIFNSVVPPKTRGARWLSGRVSDSGARGRGFETYRRRVVSLSKTLYSPKVLVNYPGSDGSVPT